MTSIRFNASVQSFRVLKEGEAKITFDIPLSDVAHILPLAGLQENLIVEVSVDPANRGPMQEIE